MKRTLTVFWCALSFFCKAQTVGPLDSLTCIKLGSNKTAVVKAVTIRCGRWDTQHSQPHIYLFNNVRFDAKSKSSLAIKFYKNKAYEADYILTPIKGVTALEYYFNLVKRLNIAYGIGKSADILKIFPANGEIGGKINDIKLGLASYSTWWPVNGHSVILSISTGLNVILAVQDDKFAQAAFECPDAG